MPCVRIADMLPATALGGAELLAVEQGGYSRAATIGAVAALASAATVASRAAMASLDTTQHQVTFLNEGVPNLYGRMGTFYWNSGNLSSQVGSDPQQGIYVPPATDATGASGAWVRVWDCTNGAPEWFYSSDWAVALEACHALCPTMRLGFRDYNITRTVIFATSYRNIIGSYGSDDVSAGSRIVLNGAAVATSPVIQLGTLNTSSVSATARRLNVKGILTFRNGIANAPASGLRSDAVPGWKIAGWYESCAEDCFDQNSPTAYRVYGTIECQIRRCGSVRTTAGAGSPDLATAFVIGGDTTSFGFIGSNASLLIEDCMNSGAVGSSPMGIYLFGYIGDTWIKRFRCSQLAYGVFVDGNKSDGTPVTALTAHQDVRVTECVIDAQTVNCVTVRNINAGGSVHLGGDNYGALNAAGNAILVDNCKGLVSIPSADLVANASLATVGVYINASKRVTVGDAVKTKDFTTGVKAVSCGQLKVTGNHTRATSGATGSSAVILQSVSRSYIAPIIDADVAAWTYGVNADAGVNYVEVNLSAINHGAFTTVSAGAKLWYSGSTWGGGPTFGTGNVVSGVLG